MKSIGVCIYRCVHDNLDEHACISGTYIPNLVCMHLGVHVYMNCKSRITIYPI